MVASEHVKRMCSSQREEFVESRTRRWKVEDRERIGTLPCSAVAVFVRYSRYRRSGVVLPYCEPFFVIHIGIRFTSMLAWEDGDMNKDRISWKLLHFMRHLPQSTQEELEHMKSFNPWRVHRVEGNEHRHSLKVLGGVFP